MCDRNVGRRAAGHHPGPIAGRAGNGNGDARPTLVVPVPDDLGNVAAFVPQAICARKGCGRPFRPRRGGKAQRFCSATCRRLNWERRHPRLGVNPRGVERPGDATA